MKDRLAVVLFIFLMPFSSTAQRSIDDFSLKNVKDNQPVSLSSMRGKDAIVVVFTSNYCPYAKLYEDRLLALHGSYASQNVGFLLINPNHPSASPEDTEELMAIRAKEKNYPFAYLADKDQTVAKMFDARKTPEAFILRPQSDGFNIVYQGAIDDNPQSPNDVREFYLKDAVELAIVGKSPQDNYLRPTGCMIRGN